MTSKPHSAPDLAAIRRTVEHRRDGGWVHATMIELLDYADGLEEQLEAAQSALREIGRTYDGVTPIFRKTGTKLLGADAFTYAPDICDALNVARRWPAAYPASEPKEG